MKTPTVIAQENNPLKKEKGVVLASSSGLLLFLCYAPSNQYWLAWFALIPLCKTILSASSIKEAAIVSGIFGVTFHLSNLSWMAQYSTLSWLAAASWLTPFNILFGTLSKLTLTHSKKNTWLVAPQLATIWVITEILQGTIKPYGINPLACSTNFLPLQQLCSLGSQGLLSWMILLVNASLAQQWNIGGKTASKSLILTSILTSSSLLFGIYTLSKKEETKTTIKVGVISTNYNDNNNAQTRWENFTKTIIETKKIGDADLILWSESTPIPILSNQTAWDLLKKTLSTKKPETIVTVTCPYYENGKKFNATLFFSNQGKEVTIYKKSVLVPIGEEPLFFLPQPESHYTKTEKRTPVEKIGNLKIGPLICIEETIPSLALESATHNAEMLICPSSNTQTGKTGALQQHAMGKLRSIETGLPLIRVGNNGITSIINNKGEEKFKTDYPGTYILDFPLKSEKTPLVMIAKLFKPKQK